MPMHRWMQSAAGGTSQRLKPAFAIVCSRSRIPAPPPDIVPALSMVAIPSSPTAAHAGHVCIYDPVVPALRGAAAPTLLPRTIFEMRQDREAHSKSQHLGRPVMPFAAASPGRLLPRIERANLPSAPQRTQRTKIGAEARRHVDRPKVATSTVSNRSGRKGMHLIVLISHRRH